MMSLDESQLLAACDTLFGSGQRASRELLNSLNAAHLKRAFRRKALLHHPDRHTHGGPAVLRRQTELFQQAASAHELLLAFLERRRACIQPTPPTRTSQPANPCNNKTSNRQSYSASAPRVVVPPLVMEFGNFLCFRDAIKYSDLFAALAWQRRQRPRLGAIAERWGWLTQTDTAWLFKERPFGRFGEKALQQGLLSSLQVQALLRYQRSLQRKLGDFFVEEGLLSRAEVERFAAELDAHNRTVCAKKRARR